MMTVRTHFLLGLCLALAWAASREMKLEYCAKKPDAESKPVIELTSFSVTPYPLHFPNLVNVTAIVELRKNLGGRYGLDITLEVFASSVWKRRACSINGGSCSYDDLCHHLEELHGDADGEEDKEKKSCWGVLQALKIPCECPIKKGTYKLENSPMDISSIFKHLDKDEFFDAVRYNATLTRNGRVAACQSLTLPLLRRSYKAKVLPLRRHYFG